MSQTIEQQIQYAIREALQEDLEETTFVHAQKLDSVDNEMSEEEYPVVIITTSTPVPQGHKSKIIEVSAWITVMSYLPEDRQKEAWNDACQAVFSAIHEQDDWDDFLPDGATIKISAIMIESGEEPGMAGKTISQTTACTVHACITT